MLHMTTSNRISSCSVELCKIVISVTLMKKITDFLKHNVTDEGSKLIPADLAILVFIN